MLWGERGGLEALVVVVGVWGSLGAMTGVGGSLKGGLGSLASLEGVAGQVHPAARVRGWSSARRTRCGLKIVSFISFPVQVPNIAALVRGEGAETVPRMMESLLPPRPEDLVNWSMGQDFAQGVEVRLALRLLYPQHLDGIWIGQDQVTS